MPRPTRTDRQTDRQKQKQTERTGLIREAQLVGIGGMEWTEGRSLPLKMAW